MAKKSAAGLVAWAEEAYKDGWVYWYGTCGYACTESLLNRKAKQYPDHYGDSRMAKYKKHIAEGRVCSDCIGLFKSYAWDKDGDIDTRASSYGSNSQPDHGAKTTLGKCKVKGDLSTMPEIPGLALWTKTGGHIGVYVGNGYVIEERGYAYGCQKNELSKRSFVTWGLYPYTEYTPEQVALAEAAANGSKTPVEPPVQKDEQEPVQKPTTPQSGQNGGKTVMIELKVLRKGSDGAQVKTLQRLLNARGYNCGNVDGKFGSKTLIAVKEFQKFKALVADGIAGEKTWTALVN
jgi:hypothetical protein